MHDRLRTVPGADCPVCHQLPCADRAACWAAFAAGEWTACLECGGSGRHSTEPRFPCPVCGGSTLMAARAVLTLLGLDPKEEK
jgi:DnaJ-class molecular chaperone